MKSLILLTATILLSSAHAQFENGFVKILEDQRYQDGASFGNFRNQEDGIKYKEETDPNGVRRGFWEYPDEHGQIKRVEFEAGTGIGFRIINSNIVAPTPIAQPKPEFQPPVQPTQPRAQPRPQPQVLPVHNPLIRQQAVIQPVHPVVTPQPEPINIFDYPADLQFFRDALGHRFKFTAV